MICRLTCTEHGGSRSIMMCCRFWTISSSHQARLRHVNLLSTTVARSTLSSYLTALTHKVMMTTAIRLVLLPLLLHISSFAESTCGNTEHCFGQHQDSQLLRIRITISGRTLWSESGCSWSCLASVWTDTQMIKALIFHVVEGRWKWSLLWFYTASNARMVENFKVRLLLLRHILAFDIAESGDWNPQCFNSFPFINATLVHIAYFTHRNCLPFIPRSLILQTVLSQNKVKVW